MSVSKQSRPLQTVINYPLVRKEARALRLLIKSALIVLLKSGSHSLSGARL